ncbi:MAG: 4-(cytidine 5'-diphospho)-2-C-methyl-D-erythritol kinase [Verrucomicrobiae bacterium]|nr:4-(cytidine 5'-diphospho)-2-C-methyl-D-erythritol kinase [Verrucomicrobiae bacterium]
MSKLELFPPAKINLFLYLLGKRSDGFHEIDTLMICTTLKDRLLIETTSTSHDLEFLCSDPNLPINADNLVVKAANLFREHTGIADSIKIVLEKKIPSGGGLGGGSSDAAYTLKGLNELFQSPLSLEKLLALATQLGSDVSFFLGEPVARCQGRGEKLSPLSHLEDLPRRAVLINPGFGVPTAWAYQTYHTHSAKKGDAEGKFPWGEMRNDLEPAVFSKYFLLPEIKIWLKSQPGIFAAMMSGSGATMFGLLEKNCDFLKLKLEFQKKFGNAAFITEVNLG